MTETTIIIVLFGYILAREVFFMYSTNKLVNKIMSHSFYDYQRSLTVGKPEPKKDQIPNDEDPPEDIGALSGIGINW